MPGFRLADRRICQPDLQGIIDPTKVVRVAIQNAPGRGAPLITTEAMARCRKNSGGGGAPGGGGMGGMDF